LKIAIKFYDLAYLITMNDIAQLPDDLSQFVITVKKACLLLMVAEIRRDRQLEERVLNFIVNNRYEVGHSDGWFFLKHSGSDRIQEKLAQYLAANPMWIARKQLLCSDRIKLNVVLLA